MITAIKESIEKLKIIKSAPLLFISIVMVFFSLLILTNFSARHNSLQNDIDGSWQYSIRNLPKQNQALGKDVFFTYGPLSPYLFSGPLIADSFLLLVLPELFNLFLLGIIFLLFVKLANLKNKSFLLLIPLSVFLMGGFFHTYFDLVIQTILLFFIFCFNYKKIRINKKIILFLAFFSSLLLLIKFSLGLTALGVFGLILIFHFSKKRINLFNFILFTVEVFIFTFLFFIFSTKSFAIFPYLFNSLALSSDYKEYMAVSTQGTLLSFLNLLLILGVLFNFTLLNKKNFLAYAFLCYIAIIYGWIRNDLHIVSTNLFIFTTLIFFVYFYLEKKEIKIIKKSIAQFILFLFASLFLVFNFFHLFLNYNLNLLNPKLNIDFFKNPAWDANQNSIITERDLINKKTTIPASIQKAIQKDSCCLMVIPNQSALPLILEKCQIHLAYLQFYSNYPQNSDILNIEKIKEVYPDIKILLHDGSIDYRIYLSEMPHLMMFIYKNFIPDVYEKGYLLLKPKNSQFEDVKCEKTDSTNHNFMKITIKKKLANILLNKTYKEPPICIDIKMSSQNQIMRRTYPSQLKKGLLLNPFPDNTNDLYKFYTGKKKPEILENYQLRECFSNEKIEMRSIEYLKCDF